MLMNTKRTLYKALANNESEWKFDRWTAIHQPTGVCYWIVNGLLFFKAYETSQAPNLGLYYSIKLYYWLREAQRKNLINTIQSKTTHAHRPTTAPAAAPK